MSGNIAVRVQGFEMNEQALVLAQLVSAHGQENEFTPRDLDAMFVKVGLPGPSRASNAIAALRRKDWVRTGVKSSHWQLTPLGKAKVSELLSDMDLVTLAAEAAHEHGPLLGDAQHTLIPPTLSPPSLIPNLRQFLDEHPFDNNVFGMTRFPNDEPSEDDPVGEALTVARDTCSKFGLELHLASDRAIHDDLWTNVAAHMWACRYGIAIFEDRVGRGLNYNLTIEVGSMLITGRRCALLKDKSIDSMPTDLVGRIYKDIDLESIESVKKAVTSWAKNDLGLG